MFQNWIDTVRGLGEQSPGLGSRSEWTAARRVLPLLFLLLATTPALAVTRYADQYASLQAALDAGPGVIYCRDGTYRLTATLRIPSHVTLTGGRGCVLSSTVSNAPIVSISAASQAGVAGITIAGPGRDLSKTGTAITVSGSNHIRIQNVELKNYQRFGIYTNHSSYVGVEKLIVETVASSAGLTTDHMDADVMFADETYDSWLTDSVLTAPTDIGVQIGPMTNNVNYVKRISIEHNRIANKYYGGVIAYSMTDNHVSDCRIHNNDISNIHARVVGAPGVFDGGFGIYLQQAHRTPITANRLSNIMQDRNGGSSLGWGAITDNVADSLIDGNSIDGVPTYDCIWVESWLRNTTGTQISNNHLNGCGRTGIFAEVLTAGVISNNTVSASGRATAGKGIWVKGSSGVTVTGNTVTGQVGMGGAFQGTADLVLEGNVWRHSTQHGLVIDTSRNVRVSDSAYNNGASYDGINIAKSTSCTVTNAHAYDDQRVHTQSRGIVASGCSILNPTAYGNTSKQIVGSPVTTDSSGETIRK